MNNVDVATLEVGACQVRLISITVKPPSDRPHAVNKYFLGRQGAEKYFALSKYRASTSLLLQVDQEVPRLLSILCFTGLHVR